MKRTKTKLVSSIVTLLICFAMLVGSTFAWFTDTASTGVNKIQAGNLDIVLEYYDGDSWEPVTESTKLFDDNALWEPGHTEVAYLHIKNAGTLDLKYKMNVNVPSETGSINQKDDDFILSNYLVFGTVENSTASFFGDDSVGRAAARAAVTSAELLSYTKTGNLFAEPTSNTNEEYVTLVIYMPETVGNEANHKTGVEAPKIELGINVVATQLASENDSFDNTYDENATYPVLAPVINSSDTVTTDTSNDTVITTPKATSIIPQDVQIASATNVVNPIDVIEDEQFEANSSLTREIKTTSSNSDSVTYDISYKYSVINGETTSTYDVSEFSKVVENIITLSPGLKNVSVTHSHGETVTNMTMAENANLKENGTYYYNEDSGELYIWSSKYSKYKISYTSDYVATIDGQGFYSIMEALDNASEYDTVYVIKDSEIVLDDTSSEFDGADRSLWYDTKNITLDFGGHIYTIKSNYGGSYNVLNVFGTGWTIKNGEIIVLRGENNEPDSYAIGVEIEDGNIAIENMTLHGGIALYDTVRATLKDTNCVMATNYYAVYLEGGASATINGGTYEASANNSIVYADVNSEATINDGTFIGTLKGGDGVITVNEGYFTDLASAIKYAADGANIKLASDIIINDTVNITKNIVLDGENRTITSGAYLPNKALINVKGENLNVTIRNINMNYGSGYYNWYGIQLQCKGGKTVIDGVNIDAYERALYINACSQTEIEVKGSTLIAIYPFNVNGGPIKSMKIEDSDLNGWTSFSNATEKYIFTNCRFGKGYGFSTVKPYGDTTFNGCTFSSDYFENLEGGIASGTKTPITINFNDCFMITSEGSKEVLTVELLRKAFNYDITSGSSSGDSTINEQYWYVNGEQIALNTTE